MTDFLKLKKSTSFILSLVITNKPHAKSTVLSNRRNTTMDGMNGRVQTVFESPLPLLSSDLQVGTHISSCGHVMHSSCWKTYFEDIQNSERNRSRLRSPQNFNALKQVFKFLLFVQEHFLIIFKFFRNFCAHCAEVCQILWFPWFLNSTLCNP